MPGKMQKKLQSDALRIAKGKLHRASRSADSETAPPSPSRPSVRRPTSTLGLPDGLWAALLDIGPARRWVLSRFPVSARTRLGGEAVRRLTGESFCRHVASPSKRVTASPLYRFAANPPRQFDMYPLSCYTALPPSRFGVSAARRKRDLTLQCLSAAPLYR